MYWMFDHSGQQIVILTNNTVILAKGKERLAVNKQSSHRFHLKKLIKVKGEGQYCVEVTNRFAALEDLDAEVVLILLRK
jgi:hypothetical protein